MIALDSPWALAKLEVQAYLLDEIQKQAELKWKCAPGSGQSEPNSKEWFWHHHGQIQALHNVQNWLRENTERLAEVDNA